MIDKLLTFRYIYVIVRRVVTVLLEDTIKAVKEAETKSGEVVKEAEEKAQSMIQNAKEDAARMVAERVEQAKEEASRRLAAEQEYGKTLEEQFPAGSW